MASAKNKRDVITHVNSLTEDNIIYKRYINDLYCDRFFIESLSIPNLFENVSTNYRTIRLSINGGAAQDILLDIGYYTLD